MKKRLLSILMVTAMCATMAVGCGTADDTKDSRLTAGMKMEEQLRRSAIKIFHFISPTEVMAFLLIILPMFHLKLPVRK